MPPRAIVVGLDCVPPRLAFDALAEELPTLSGLRARGVSARLRSTVPPITVPAWATMTSGRDPGELGLYGFRNRVRGSYALRLATSADVRAPRLWDRAGAAGRRVAVLGVPPSAPPVPVRGDLVACLLQPGTDRPWTFPGALAQELEARHGPWRFDVEGFRSLAPDALLEQLGAMTRQRFDAARDLWERRSPDLLMLVDMGPDRLHHACFAHLDPAHPAHDPGHPLVAAARAYYRDLDGCLGALLEGVDDDVAVFVVSDHGARPLRGGVHVNEWLRELGLLALRPGAVTSPRPLRPEDVDWSRTRVWAEGGYHARVMVNVRGREPEGVVPPAEVPRLLDQVEAALEALRGPDGAAVRHTAVRPERAFRAVRALPPELFVFFGDLDLRALGTVGTGTLFSPGNDTGPDACNHDWDGIFVAAGGGAPRRDGVAPDAWPIAGVAPTVLAALGVAPPPDLAAGALFAAEAGA